MKEELTTSSHLQQVCIELNFGALQKLHRMQLKNLQLPTDCNKYGNSTRTNKEAFTLSHEQKHAQSFN